MGTSFKQLETSFQRTLNEYKTTYEDYMVALKHQGDEYWKTKDNVFIANDTANIPFLTYPNITKKTCLHSCASDSNCKYVLFSDSGNGECAANKCLKWTKDAKGFVDAKRGELTKNKACAPGSGPAETNYLYSGWEKPTWNDEKNISFMGDPKNINSTEWKKLGNAGSLTACKEMATASSDGPFSSVVFIETENKCYGSIPTASFEKRMMEGVYSSVPPLETTNVGGEAVLGYIKKLNTLNDALKELLYKMNTELTSIEKKSQGEQDVINNTQTNIQVDYNKLTNDKTKLKEMKKTLDSLDAKLGELNDITDYEKLIYIATIILVLSILAFYSNKIFFR